MRAPLVSILIPCHNAERWVGEAIESALAQTYAPKEVIVIDDGSTDRSRDVITGFDDRISALFQENAGSNPTRNRLLEKARGDWVQYLDADDYLEPDKIADQMALLPNAPEADVLWQSITIRRETPEGPVLTRFGHHLAPIDMWTKFILWHTPQTGAFLYHVDALRNVGGWDPTQPCCQDNALTLALLMAGRQFQYVSSYGAVYREHSTATLSRRDPGRVMRERAKLLDRAEDYLATTGDLTPARTRALSQARIQIARTLWVIDRGAAEQLFTTVQARTPGFFGEAPIPAHYRRIACLVGFSGAERMAEILRRIRLPNTWTNL